MVDLDQRKRAVLRVVVEEHVRSAEPVGSEQAQAQAQLNLSSATIRSTMAGLEELGLLTHPHTSAGRIPTDQGYRAYVDGLLETERLSATERQTIRRRLGDHGERPDDVAAAAAQVLSSLTQYASFIAAPGLGQQVFESLHLLPLDANRALAVISTSAGALQGRAITLPAEVSADDLESLGRIITNRLRGALIASITHEQIERALGEAYRHQQLLDAVKAWLRRDLARGTRLRVRVEGLRHLLREPEFRRADAATPVLGALEEESVLAHAVAAAPEEGVWVTIGAENQIADLRACSIVMATYQSGGATGGAVAIIGPTRMRYQRALAAVQYVADRLSDSLGA
jgi:heat-inducible transcriptional repressor